MTQALFDAGRHEALAGAPWSEAAARAGIDRIVADACARFDPQTLWPRHPRDVEKGEPDLPAASLYHGAAGVIWALDHLRERGHGGRDFDAAKPGLVAHSQRFAQACGTGRASYLLGEAGVRLLEWKATRSEASAEALHALVESNLRNPTLEFLWGSPGTLTAALHMLEASGEARWQEIFERGIEILWQQMERASGHDAVWLWAQDLYGRQRRWLGAGHGFAGNLLPVLRGARWLAGSRVDAFEARALRTLRASAMIDGDRVNWEPVFDPASHGLSSRPIVQDCHGAPGIVCRLAGCRSPALREWLRRGAELVWAAGPLKKGAGLCHGTAGNGYALLKLHRVTGDALWQTRARAFAMHALAQVEREADERGQRWPSLWTGDLGVALYLSACLTGDDRFPTLDVF